MTASSAVTATVCSATDVTRQRERAGRWLGSCLLAFAATLPLSIAAAQIALTAAFLSWFLAGRPRPPVPQLKPALAFAALTLLSAVCSPDPVASLRDTKELLLLFVLLAVPAAALRRAALPDQLLRAWLIGGVASAVYGIAAYFASNGGLLHRSSGPFGHYMTFGGMMMLCAVAAFTGLLASTGRTRHGGLGWLAALLALLAAVAVSWARNAWLGLAAGAALSLLLLRKRLLIALPVVLGLSFLVASSEMQERIASIFDLSANQDRVEMLRFGRELIARHPLTGVGPNQIPVVWSAAHPGQRIQPHLHDNFVQIASERGLPALAAWLWLVGATLLRAARSLSSGSPPLLPAVTLSATTAMLVAGLFEYNFGDSEVKMAWLLLAALGTLSGVAPAEINPSETSPRT